MKTGFGRRDFLKIVTAVFGAGIVSACERLLPTQTPDQSQLQQQPGYHHQLPHHNVNVVPML